MYIPKNAVNFLLDVGNQIHIAYNWDLKDLLTIMDHNSEHEVVIGVKKSLIKKKAAFKIAKLV